MHFYNSNRYICDVLTEMRELTKTLNFSSMASLIEEAQSMVNRMENKLYQIKDLAQLEIDVKKLKKEVAALEKAKEEAGGVIKE